MTVIEDKVILKDKLLHNKVKKLEKVLKKKKKSVNSGLTIKDIFWFSTGNEIKKLVQTNLLSSKQQNKLELTTDLLNSLDKVSFLESCQDPKVGAQHLLQRISLFFNIHWNNVKKGVLLPNEVLNFEKQDPNKKLLVLISVKATSNNTLITVTDLNGNTICWSSPGMLGFKGAKRGTSYAAQAIVEDIVKKIIPYRPRIAIVLLKGFGKGRYAAISTLRNKGVPIKVLIDRTPIPFNGCRPPKRRRL
jgi:small subunit ribosomal protein S11